ncbi:retrovirus-related pol polyprotein from transposon TNT 1-94 [Tanacetum coccineum]
MSRRYPKTKKALITTHSDSPISTAFFSNNIVKDFQENSNDEADERSSEEYLRYLELEFHEKALLEPSKQYGSINCGGIVFSKLSFVNGLKYNLISIGQLCDAKYIVQFDDKQGTIFDANKEIVLIAQRRNDVYVLDMSLLTSNEACFFAKSLENVFIHNHKDHLGKFDAKADDGYFLRYSFVSKAFRVFNTRRQQIEETYHVTFDESMEAIRFTNTSVNEIGIDDSSRYPPDKFL